MTTTTDLGRRKAIQASLIAGLTSSFGIHAACPQENKIESAKRKQPTNRFEGFRAVSPALEHYADDALLNGVWKRGELSRRDRSLVTCAALIARLQTVDMPYYFFLALDSGLKPSELSETITHLAFYSGWPNATAAVTVAAELFQSGHVSQHDLPQAKPKLLPLDEAAETQRATMVSTNLGATTPGLVQNTTDLLFRDLWLRPALAPRDRSLVRLRPWSHQGKLPRNRFTSTVRWIVASPPAKRARC